jgi:hypothetical protein
MSEPCKHEREMQELKANSGDYQAAAQKALRDANHEIALLTDAVFERDATIARMRTGRP